MVPGGVHRGGRKEALLLAVHGGLAVQCRSAEAVVVILAVHLEKEGKSTMR